MCASGMRGSDRRRTEQDAAADDVGDDDGGGVEGTEPPLEDCAWRSWSCQARPGLYGCSSAQA